MSRFFYPRFKYIPVPQPKTNHFSGVWLPLAQLSFDTAGVEHETI